MKQALITGGARGIGFGIAEAMLAADYVVTVTGLTAEEIACVPKRDHLEAIQFDVTSDADVTACIGKFQQLDALVNCAGIILRDGSAMEIAAQAQLEGVNSLRQSGLRKVKLGLTSLQEILSCTNA